MGMIEARRHLTTLPEEFEREPELGTVAVTRRGKPVLAVMPWELYEAIIETLEIMGDEEQMNALRLGIKELEDGKLIPWEDVKAELGL
jgi:PHD/YefM family antitoxin component YafN of YafNO toxin-antitoxin module